MQPTNPPQSLRKTISAYLLLSGIALLSFVTLLFGPGLLSQVQLRMAHAQWEKQHLTDYRYTIEQRCGMCPSFKATVEVRHGKSASVQMIRETTAELVGQEDSWAQEFIAKYGTIDGVFLHLQELGGRPTVRYDPMLRYPSFVQLRGGGLEPLHLTITIVDFEQLSGD